MDSFGIPSFFKMDKVLLRKSVKRLIWTLVLMIASPLILASAFKNDDHPLFYPVLVLGVVLGILAISLGFTGIQKLTRALLGKPRA